MQGRTLFCRDVVGDGLAIISRVPDGFDAPAALLRGSGLGTVMA
jgi:hypothetical protein